MRGSSGIALMETVIAVALIALLGAVIGFDRPADTGGGTAVAAEAEGG